MCVYPMGSALCCRPSNELGLLCVIVAFRFVWRSSLCSFNSVTVALSFVHPGESFWHSWALFFWPCSFQGNPEGNLWGQR